MTSFKTFKTVFPFQENSDARIYRLLKVFDRTNSLFRPKTNVVRHYPLRIPPLKSKTKI